MQATKDDFYLRVGERILADLNQRLRTKCGFATLRNVETGEVSHYSTQELVESSLTRFEERGSNGVVRLVRNFESESTRFDRIDGAVAVPDDSSTCICFSTSRRLYHHCPTRYSPQKGIHYHYLMSNRPARRESDETYDGVKTRDVQLTFDPS